jgi:hypothetical protein
VVVTTLGSAGGCSGSQATWWFRIAALDENIPPTYSEEEFLLMERQSQVRRPSSAGLPAGIVNPAVLWNRLAQQNRPEPDLPEEYRQHVTMSG